MSSKVNRWSLAIGYVAFIYATLSYVRIPVNYLRSQGILSTSLLILFGIFFGSILIAFIRTQTKEVWRYILFFTFLGVLIGAASYVQQPEEKIHFLQYALVGIFFARALSLHSSTKWKILLGSFVLGSLAGWFDEVIQGWLPNRHYDIRDIQFNVFSVLLGLSIYAVFPKKRGQNTP